MKLEDLEVGENHFAFMHIDVGGEDLFQRIHKRTTPALNTTVMISCVYVTLHPWWSLCGGSAGFRASTTCNHWKRKKPEKHWTWWRGKDVKCGCISNHSLRLKSCRSSRLGFLNLCFLTFSTTFNSRIILYVHEISWRTFEPIIVWNHQVFSGVRGGHMPSPQRASDAIAVWEMVLTCKKDTGSFRGEK